MRKLLKLRAWLNLSEAAEYLSLLFAEEIRQADLLRLALDGRLILSVRFVNNVWARIGPAVPISEANQTEFNFGGETVSYIEGLQLNDEWVLELSREPRPITEVWDLAMFGGERLDIEHLYQSLTGGPDVMHTSNRGPIVFGNGVFCQLQEHLLNNPKMDKGQVKEPWSNPDNFYPATFLPADALLVVRPDALADLIVQVQELEIADAPALASPQERQQEAIIATGGRPLSALWPDWVAELTAHIHEHGFPAGEGTFGQDRLIAAVEAKLSERGLDAPSRATVQPAVKAVLARLRSARN